MNTEEKIEQRSQEEIAQEYKKLKARNEWIKMNQKYLDQIQRKQLFYHRLILIVICFQFLFNLIQFIL